MPVWWGRAVADELEPQTAAADAQPNPRPDSPDTEQAPLVRPACSLAESMGDLVDDVRQMYTDFGLRPYRLFSIVVRWSGGQRGRGEPTVVSEREFLPTPLIKWGGRGSGDHGGAATPGGVEERGTVQVTELSPRYTEDEIRGLFHVQRGQLQPGEEGFLEMVMDGRDGLAIRRRFVVKGTPWRDAEGFQWRSTLLAQDDRRDRVGRPLDLERQR